MSDQASTELRQFFGDKEQAFQLTAPMIVELERTTGTGIGGLCKRLFNSDFRLLEISEVIRLGLIGGGTAPETAQALVSTYVNGTPLANSLPVAIAILEALMFGAAKPANQEASNGTA